MTERNRDLEQWRNGLLELLSEEGGRPDAPAHPEEGARAEPDAGRLEVLSFTLGDETFGVDIRKVSEILLPRPLTRLPRAPEFILGVVSLRGTILPVTDTGIRLGLRRERAEAFARILVIRDGEEYMGFVVDGVTGVVRFTPEEVRSTEYAASVDPKFLTGIGYDSRQRLVALLSAERLCDFSLDDA